MFDMFEKSILIYVRVLIYMLCPCVYTMCWYDVLLFVMCVYGHGHTYVWIIHWHEHENALCFLENEKVDFSKWNLKKERLFYNFNLDAWIHYWLRGGYSRCLYSYEISGRMTHWREAQRVWKLWKLRECPTKR